MEDDAAVSEEGAEALDGRRVQVDVRHLPLVHVPRDVAVLAAKVADLAGFRGRLIAGGGLAADIGVEVGERRRAVGVHGDRIHVEVVGCEKRVSNGDAIFLGQV